MSTHGGLTSNSGDLPALIEESTLDMEEEESEVDEDGYQWVASAEPPPSEDSDEGTSSGAAPDLEEMGEHGYLEDLSDLNGSSEESSSEEVQLY